MDTFHSLTGFWTLLNNLDSEHVKALAAQHVWLVTGVCFASGILTSLTPCVYPMIPITINIFGRISQQHGKESGKRSSFDFRTFTLAGVYVAGMCATYSVMGLIAGLTGSLFGKLLQSSYMLAFLTILFLALALGQLGLFKMALPGSVQTKLSQWGNAESVLGIFVMGLISGLIVSPCVGPVIAGIIAFVVDSSDAFRGFIYFFSFSLGLGVLFLLIGGFSGVLSALPRSGTWMVRINRILASLMVVASAYYGFLWMKQIGVFQRPHTEVSKAASALQWNTNEDEAFKKALALKVPVIVDFGADWCAECHVIDETVFSDPAVVKKLSQFVLLRIDLTADTPENEAKRKKYGVMSLPTVLFVDRKGNILDNPRVHGVLKPEEFLTLINTL